MSAQALAQSPPPYTGPLFDAHLHYNDEACVHDAPAPGCPHPLPDVLARMLTQKLQTTLGASMVVDNQPGAGGISAAIGITKTAPDGHTLFFGDSGSMALPPSTASPSPRHDWRVAPLAGAAMRITTPSPPARQCFLTEWME